MLRPRRSYCIAQIPIAMQQRKRHFWPEGFAGSFNSQGFSMLKGKNAVVTGSTSGIGLGIARAMAGAGASVMLNGFGDGGEIERLRAGIASEFKVKALYSPADMSKPAEIAAMIQTAESALGSVDLLVNNAGIQ